MTERETPEGVPVHVPYSKLEEALAAEIVQLKAEVERLRAENADLKAKVAYLWKVDRDRREAAAEIGRLTAENAELRAALQIWMQGPRREL